MDMQMSSNMTNQQLYPTNTTQSIDIKTTQNKTNESITHKTQQGTEYVGNMQEKTVIEAIEKANKKLEGNNKEFHFSVHEKTKQIMVKVIDTQTKEIIKEFPPENILDMVASMWEAAGLFVDEKR